MTEKDVPTGYSKLTFMEENSISRANDIFLIVKVGREALGSVEAEAEELAVVELVLVVAESVAEQVA